jgi:hypothetical protein
MVGPLGQEIGAAIAGVREMYVADLMPDTCQIERGTIPVSDGAGGSTNAPNVVATHVCKLSVAQRLGTEAGTDHVSAASGYVARLPLDADVRATDTLLVNGREFAVTGVKRGGQWATSLLVELEERS